MPELCRFYGIVIYMFHGDHNPPHFHVRYQEHRAVVRFDPLGILHGTLPPKAIALVMEWARLHESELRENWARATSQQGLLKIAPLE